MSNKIKKNGEDPIILPKTDKDGAYYLSYSQYSTWKKSKREYIRQYFMGERFEGNAYTDFGSMIGEALENNVMDPFTTKEQKFLKTIPRFDEFEREIKFQLDGFHIKGFIDTNSAPEKKDGKLFVRVLADYKTGDIEKKRDEYQSDDYVQLDIYAGALHQEYGVLPEEVKVFLIQRDGNAFKGEELTLGDKYIVIDKNVDLERIEAVRADVQKVAKEISDTYKVFLKLNGLI